MARQVVEELVSAILSRDANALAELFADDAVMHHPLSAVPIEGKAAIAASEQALFDAFSDIEIEVVRVVAEAEDIVVELVLRATNTRPLDVGGDERLPVTGRWIELPSVSLLRLGADQRIVEERDYLDTASFFQQLGLGSEA